MFFTVSSRIILVSLSISISYSSIVFAQCGRESGANINASGKIYDLTKIKANFGTADVSTFSCPTPPAPPAKFDPPSFYLSDGVTPNPAFYEHMKPFHDFINKVNELGDLFLASQSQKVADCTAGWLVAWSSSGLFTEYRDDQQGRLNYTTTQGDYERKWIVGELLLNFAKLKHGGAVISSTRQSAFKSWMSKTMLGIRAFYDNRIRYNASTGIMERPENLNNHQYWAGLAVYLYGKLFSASTHVSWGVLQYKLGINSIKNDGTLATEMARGGHAFIYHQFALQPLIMLAEVDKIYGGSLYSYNVGRLKLLVGLIDNAFSNFSTFQSKTSVTQVHTPQIMINELPYYLDWMEIWNSRFNQATLRPHVLSARNSVKSPGNRLRNFRLGGDMTMAFGVSMCKL